MPIHLLAPLTLIPIIKTSTSKAIEIIRSCIDQRLIVLTLILDVINIKATPLTANTSWRIKSPSG
jgi:hypothetical protein